MPSVAEGGRGHAPAPQEIEQRRGRIRRAQGARDAPIASGAARALKATTWGKRIAWVSACGKSKAPPSTWQSLWWSAMAGAEDGAAQPGAVERALAPVASAGHCPIRRQGRKAKAADALLGHQQERTDCASFA